MPLLEVTTFATAQVEHPTSHAFAWLRGGGIVKGTFCKLGDEHGFYPVVEIFETDDGRVTALGDADVWAGVIWHDT